MLDYKTRNVYLKHTYAVGENFRNSSRKYHIRLIQFESTILESDNLIEDRTNYRD